MSDLEKMNGMTDWLYKKMALRLISVKEITKLENTSLSDFNLHTEECEKHADGSKDEVKAEQEGIKRRKTKCFRLILISKSY